MTLTMTTLMMNTLKMNHQRMKYQHSPRNLRYLWKKIGAMQKRGPKNLNNPNPKRETKEGTRRKKGLKMNCKRKKYKRMKYLRNQEMSSKQGRMTYLTKI